MDAFANTDLDLLLRKHGIHQLIVIGLIPHTCIEATVRSATELGYQVTVVKDATADYSDKEMHAALELRQRHCHHKGSHRLDFISVCLGSQYVVEARSSFWSFTRQVASRHHQRSDVCEQ
jgi:nicotinamidase-related amidase